jgi:hypothetical protein
MSAAPATILAYDDFELVDNLRHIIISDIESNRNGNTLKGPPTVGVELEFFLLDRNGCLAGKSFAHDFFHSLSKKSGWTKSHDNAHAEIEISACSRELGKNRYTKVKYEYPYHLLEVAFSYYSNLNDLHVEATRVFQELHDNAENLGGRLQMSPFAASEQAIGSQQSTQKIKSLNESRRKYMLSQGHEPVPEVYLFTSYTAGTQIHIGGIDWFHNPKIISNLYTLESYHAFFGVLEATSNLAEAQALLQRRTSLYKRSFPNMVLTGFPDIAEWTIDTWIKGMLESPLGAGAGEQNEGKSYLSLNPDSRPNLAEIKSSLRDLQFVRPRLIGTIEFRSDPSVATVKSLVAIAAWRLAMSLMARSGKLNLLGESHHKSLARWNYSVQASVPRMDDNAQSILREAKKMLKERGLGEEKFLGEDLI